MSLLPIEVWSLIASYLRGEEKAPLSLVCRNAKLGVELDDTRLKEFVFLTIARLGQEALKARFHLDLTDRQACYRTGVAQVDRFLGSYCPPLAKYTDRFTLRAQLEEYRQLNPRYHYGQIHTTNGVIIPLQRRQFFEFLNQILPTERKIKEEGLDLTPIENEGMEVFSLWLSQLESGENNKDLYQKVLLALQEAKIDCETRIGTKPLLCLAAEHGLHEMVALLINRGAYIEDSAPPVSPTALVAAVQKVVLKSTPDNQLQAYFQTIVYLLEQGANAEALVEKNITLPEFLAQKFESWLYHPKRLAQVLFFLLHHRKGTIILSSLAMDRFAKLAVNEKNWVWLLELIEQFPMQDVLINGENDTLFHFLVVEATNTHSKDADYLKFQLYLSASGRQPSLNGNTEMIREMAFECLEQLLKKGTSIKTRNKKGRTPLVHMFEQSVENFTHVDRTAFLRVVKLCFKFQFEELRGNPLLNSKAFNEPLLFLAMHQDKEVFELLIAAGADLNVQTYDGRTALSEALSDAMDQYASNKHERGLSYLKKLLHAGADPNVKGPNSSKEPLLLSCFSWFSCDEEARKRAVQLCIDLCSDKLEQLDAIKAKLV